MTWAKKASQEGRRGGQREEDERQKKLQNERDVFEDLTPMVSRLLGVVGDALWGSPRLFGRGKHKSSSRSQSRWAISDKYAPGMGSRTITVTLLRPKRQGDSYRFSVHVLGYMGIPNPDDPWDPLGVEEWPIPQIPVQKTENTSEAALQEALEKLLYDCSREGISFATRDDEKKERRAAQLRRFAYALFGALVGGVVSFVLYLLGYARDNGLLMVLPIILGPPLGAYLGVHLYIKSPKDVRLVTLGSALLWNGICLVAVIVLTFVWEDTPDWLVAFGILLSALGALAR